MWGAHSFPIRDKLELPAVAHVSKHGVIHELEKILKKWCGCLQSFHSVGIYIFFQPWTLIKPQYIMYVGHLHS